MEELEKEDKFAIDGPYFREELDWALRRIAESPQMQQRWREVVAELRLTDKAQGAGRLLRLASYGDEKDQFCCLGVICELAVQRWKELAGTRNDHFTTYKFYSPEPNPIWDSSGTGLPGPLAHHLGLRHSSMVLSVPAKVVVWAQAGHDNPGDEAAVWRAKAHPGMLTTAVSLNDNYRLPFDKIADCIEFTYLPGDWSKRMEQGNDEPAAG